MSDDAGNHSDATDTLNYCAQEKGATGSEEEQNKGEKNESEQGDCAGVRERNEVDLGRVDEKQARGEKQPPAKKRKTKGKKTTAEKITESTMKAFLEFQERKVYEF